MQFNGGFGTSIINSGAEYSTVIQDCLGRDIARTPLNEINDTKTPRNDTKVAVRQGPYGSGGTARGVSASPKGLELTFLRNVGPPGFTRLLTRPWSTLISSHLGSVTPRPGTD